MHRYVRRGGALLGGVVGLLGVGVASLYGASASKFHADLSALAPVREIPETTGEEAIARGRHGFEVLHGCGHCHGDDAGGGEAIIDDPAMGRIEGANLTTGNGGVLPRYDLAHFARVVRHGIKHDGTPVLFMPSDGYTHLSDREVADLWAFLHSLPPVDRVRAPASPGPLARVLFLTGKMPILASAYVVDHTTTPPAVPPPTTDLAAYGAHIGTGCTGCHGANLGGGPIPGAPPDWPAAPNISPSADGIGEWAEEDFVRTLTTLENPKGVKLREPMASQAVTRYTPEEYHALWTFLRGKPGVPDNPGAGRLEH